MSPVHTDLRHDGMYPCRTDIQTFCCVPPAGLHRTVGRVFCPQEITETVLVAKEVRWVLL